METISLVFAVTILSLIVLFLLGIVAGFWALVIYAYRKALGRAGRAPKTTGKHYHKLVTPQPAPVAEGATIYRGATAEPPYGIGSIPIQKQDGERPNG